MIGRGRAVLPRADEWQDLAMVHTDTSAEADRVQVEAYRRMGGAGRIAALFRLNERARNLAMAGIRHRHPEYDEERQRLAFARLVLGDELVRKVWPDRDLVEP
ncbi:MAG: hypothetical protein DMF78_17055 [Acidobacteria bacterium]|nr:MAG: hypothetical protein DMF78_17055 [Acidobacteriota bacterium]